MGKVEEIYGRGPVNEYGVSMGMSANETRGLTNADVDNLIVLADNTQAVIDAFPSAINRALEAIGLKCEGYAKKECPVDTGRLRNSITHTIDRDSAYVGTNVEYAPFIELGTTKRKPKPFLVPAATEHADVYRNLLKKAMETA